jgi:hypothetical protein
MPFRIVWRNGILIGSEELEPAILPSIVADTKSPSGFIESKLSAIQVGLKCGIAPMAFRA